MKIRIALKARTWEHHRHVLVQCTERLDLTRRNRLEYEVFFNLIRFQYY